MKRFSWRRALAIFSKEFKHIMRDPFTLIMALLLPLTIVLILGNSIEFNIKSIHLACVDHDQTESSRRLIDTFGSSDYFKTYPLANPGEFFIRHHRPSPGLGRWRRQFRHYGHHELSDHY